MEIVYIALGFVGGFVIGRFQKPDSPLVTIVNKSVDLTEILSKIDKVLDAVKPLPASEISFYEKIQGKYERVYMSNIKVTEEKTYKVAFKDAKQNDAMVDGTGAWSLTNPAMATLTPSADGLTCLVVPTGMIGDCELQVLADADLSANGVAEDGSVTGVKEILGRLPLTFIAGEAVEVQISEA